MKVSEEILKRFSPPRCPKCGGLIYLATQNIISLSSKELTTYSCISCGFVGYKTNKQCHECNKDIVRIKNTTEKCLGCHDKWSSDFLKNLYTKKIKKKIILKKDLDGIFS